MIGIALYISLLLVLGFITLWLHYINPRFGFYPLLFFIAAHAAILSVSSPIVILIEPYNGLIMTMPWDILVPVILLIVLILYVADGTMPAQQAIYGVAGVNLFAMITLFVLQLFANVPSALNVETLNDVLQFDLRQHIAGSLVFIVDMFIIIVFYQGVKNVFPGLSDWLLVGMAILITLWTDSVLFHLLGTFGTDGFVRLLPGDIAAKTIAGVVLWLPAAYYIARIAPTIPEFAGNHHRPTFAVVFGALSQLNEALRQSRAELHESKIDFQQLTERINEIFWLADATTRRIYYISPVFEQVTGITREQIYQNPKSIATIIHEEDRETFFNNFRNFDQDQYDEQIRIYAPDESLRIIHNKVFTIRGEDGTPLRLAGVAEDITEAETVRHQALQLTIEQEKMRVLRDFISDASHDLKSPISTILLKAQLIEITEDTSKRKKHIDDLITQAHRLSDLIDNLFTLSRLEEDTSLKRTPVAINQLLQDLYTAMKPQADAKNITFKLDLERQVIPEVAVNVEDFSRAVSNLIGNAIRYTPSEGSITVQSRYQFENIIIRVSDSGIGIHQDELDHIFDRFYRAKTATLHNINGNGLGLAIVKRIIKQHGGEIIVESTIGKGTTFTISMPIYDR